MVSLSGMSAAYPGFLAAQDQDAIARLHKMQAASGETDLLGQQAYGRTLASLAQVPGTTTMQQPGAPFGGPQGAMAMPPGQASQPMQHGGGPMPLVNSQQQFRPMPQPGMQAGGQGMPTMAPGGPQLPQMPPGQLQGGAPQLNWQSIAQQVAKANPGAKPEVIAAAVDKFLPLMNQQSQQEWKMMSLALASQRTDQGQQRIDQRDEQFQQREERLKASGAVKQDQAWQRLEVQKGEAARKATSGQDKNALSQWRALVDAQHKRASEIIQASAINSGLSKEDKKALLAEQDDFYDTEITSMKERMKNPDRVTLTTTVPANVKNPVTNKETGRLSDGSSPEAEMPPPEALKQLKEGTITIFNNGQRWTLENGQPKQLDALKNK
jgi:hypothetical protein